MRHQVILSLALAVSPHIADAAGVSGKAFGFATGVTGGGSAPAATPTSLAQLTSWLTDSTARTIMIDRKWSYIGSEGTTNGRCCSTRTTVCSGGSSQGQLTITDSCTDGTAVSCSYDTAGTKPIDVGSNKSIVGVGSAGVIEGKGLRVRGGNSNVIIQNIHFTNINPRYVWGGDAITLDSTDRIWIDHNKFSLIGRQMIVSGWGKAGKVTISYNEFDGVTSWSSGCNGKHYWTLLLIGLEDYYTFAYNHVHDVSGRAPHYGTTATASRIFFHAANNYFADVGGHAFDADANTHSLIEGNYFQSVTTPMSPASLTNGGALYTTVTVAEAGACPAYTGYICEWNKAYGSGAWPDVANAGVLSVAASYKQYLFDPMDVAAVPNYVKANAGVGKV
ncbi:putative pectin lyase [Rosellinia necatrix]|uniref:pectin lyase n=1 Tax=Rosellinia necatrix TaxID=77044 RepID=A0A1W2TTB6_ROSNE|nr:putative pectin lyase [Rosellinia necatrix]